MSLSHFLVTDVEAFLGVASLPKLFKENTSNLCTKAQKDTAQHLRQYRPACPKIGSMLMIEDAPWKDLYGLATQKCNFLPVNYSVTSTSTNKFQKDNILIGQLDSYSTKSLNASFEHLILYLLQFLFHPSNIYQRIQSMGQKSEAAEIFQWVDTFFLQFIFEYLKPASPRLSG